MTSLEQLLHEQSENGEEIQRLISNFKKDSKERKTKDYLKNKVVQLEALTTAFEDRHEEIIRSPECPQVRTHLYFVNDYHMATTTLASQYVKIFKEALSVLRTTQKGTHGSGAAQGASSSSAAGARDQQALAAVPPQIRKQHAQLAALQRLIDSFGNSTVQIQIDTMQDLWGKIQQLHYSIIEEVETPEESGYKGDWFITLESLVLQTMIQHSQSLHPRETYTTTSSPLSLPKISIPKFDGDYLKWKQFFDMFSQMVDQQPLPNIQKMWYLKSNIAGEAERLLRHLPSTADNYLTAWTMLQDRFDNKRIITANLIQRLLSLPQLTDNASANMVKALHDGLFETLEALKNIGVNITGWDPLILQLMIKKLDRHTHMLYEQSLTAPKELPKLVDFIQFLELRFQTLEATGQIHKTPTRGVAMTAIKTSQATCVSCRQGTHPLFACSTFRSLNPPQRLQLVQQNGLCVNCLKAGHKATTCTHGSCQQCKQKHNTLLHLNDKVRPPLTPPFTTNNQGLKEQSPSVLSTIANRSYVILGTVLLTIATADGQTIRCRAILDSGSQINLITEKLARKLQLPLNLSPTMVEGIGQQKGSCKGFICTSIQSINSEFTTTINAFIIPKIVAPQPSQVIDISSWRLPSNITLADPKFHQPGEIDLLIGAELYHSLLSAEQIQTNEQCPIFQNTTFGWMCCGKIDHMAPYNATCGILSESEDALDEILTRFWQMDDSQPSNQMLTEAEQRCEEHFNHSTTRNSEGRFIVRIPFSLEPKMLGQSLQMATNRFYSIEQRLMKQPELKRMYIEFMQEYERLGHMKRVQNIDDTLPYYVIPHHCVLKPDSTTTKLRVVFDASAKTSTGLSLNELMHKGPVVQSELLTILLRFRIHRYVFTTDIEKMYRQIVIHHDDQRFQLILWRENPEDKLQFFQLKTVTYGTRAAPYLSTKCLQRIATDNMDLLPLGAMALKNDFYVDDGLTGSDHLNTAIIIKQQLSKMLLLAGFKLRKWCSNSSQLLEGTPISDQEIDLDLADESSKNSIKTLGLMWLPKSDAFFFKTTLDDSTPITKRMVVSEVAKVFDPLGLVSPVIVKAKILIQTLWQLKLGWDDEIPEQHKEDWLHFRTKLKQLNNLRVPRHIFKHNLPQDIQLHVFTDASERAYGAAVYIRSLNKDGTICVQLLCSKSRVAPLKTQTIPRLELCASLLGAELISRVRTDLQYHHVITHMWTDSEIVLHWINSEPATFQTFVSHRIAKIQSLTSAKQWRHVGSKENPADLLSRGISPDEIQEKMQWFHGPMFLHGREECWPGIFRPQLSLCENIEAKKYVCGLTSTHHENLSTMIYHIDHKGSFRFLQRTLSYVLRFTSLARGIPQSNDMGPSSTEMRNALSLICKAIQHSEFSDEIQQLTAAKGLKISSAISTLAPFLDDYGVLRVGGRLQQSCLPFDARHPILLPYNDPIAKLIMRQLHEENMHCGPQALLAHTRQRFWPIKGKIMARSIVQHCVRCTRSQPKLFTQVMGHLPRDRVQLARPFLNAGVDFCGPIWIHYKIRGKRPCKAYIAVFCCFATKALHLEIVSDLTTGAFLGALNRFIARRGRCQNLYCDNATNFVGAKNQLQELEDAIYEKKAKEQITGVCTDKGIDFHFIPPRAPHFGGLWEAAVKSAKHLLLRGVGNVSLTYEELETVVVQIEGILNSRPLTPMSSNPNDLAALTPGHFLIGEPLTAHPTTGSPRKTNSLMQRWKLVQQIKEEFWARWTKEYLNELQHRHKWKTQKINIEIGTMVIIKEENIPSLQWPLGRIDKVFKGPDGHVRVVEVRTANGILKRAIHQLSPLFPSETKKLDDQLETKSPPIPEKKRRLGINSTLVSILAVLCLLPLILGSPVKITKFNNTPGIHFENLGKTRIITTNWNLIVYYDLEPLKTELNTFRFGIQTLRVLCEKLQDKSCDNLAQQLSATEYELTEDTNLVLHKRTKRGAVNIIGNVANSLFGVLDSDYAKRMSTTIHNIDDNENYMLDLIRNQTSLIDSTLNIIKIDETNIKQKIDSYDKTLAYLTNSVKTIEDQVLYQHLFSTAIHLILTASKLQRIQSTIFNVLTDVHHDQIGPLLLSPEQLKLEITKIRGHLSPSLQFPIQHEDILTLYKLMKVETGLTNTHILFKVIVPLIAPEEFNTFQVFPIPTIVNNSMISVKATTELLAITAHGNKYFPMTKQEYANCLVVTPLVSLCQNTQSIYKKGAPKNLCEVNLYNNDTSLACSIVEVTTNQWLQLNRNNQWLFAVTAPTKVTTVCAEELNQLIIEGSGVLTIDPQCEIQGETFTIKGHRLLSSSLRISITTQSNWSNLLDPQTMTPVLLENAIRPYSPELQDLMALQSSIHANKILDLPHKLQQNSYHTFGIGYTALGLVIILILFFS